MRVSFPVYLFRILVGCHSTFSSFNNLTHEVLSALAYWISCINPILVITNGYPILVPKIVEWLEILRACTPRAFFAIVIDCELLCEVARCNCHRLIIIKRD